MRHEIAHGMWYLNSKYQKKQQKNVDIINREYPEFGATLLQMGYCKEVINDELQAYFSTSSMTYLADDAFEDWEIPWDLVLQCQRTFEEFYEKLSDTDEEL